jgi:hypothetical protein
MRKPFRALVALVTVLGLSSLGLAGDRPDKLEVGKLAPAFDVKGWVNSKPIEIGDLTGKVVLLDFWGVW